MQISLSAITHTGLERDNNEDAFTLCPDLTHPKWANSQEQNTAQCSTTSLGSLGALVVVADGIGGFNAGEVASGIATQTVAQTFTSEAATAAATSEEASHALLCQAIAAAHEAINQHIIDDFHTVGMGTTVVIAWIQPEHTHIAWCGDSRCYLYTTIPPRGLEGLTTDHSYVQQLVDRGEITPEEALTHPDNNIITRALGDVDCSAEPEVITIPTQPDTTLMLCTDGLCGYVTDPILEQTIQTHYQHPDKCCNARLQLALNAGGYDNIAIAVAHLTDRRPNLLQRIFKV